MFISAFYVLNVIIGSVASPALSLVSRQAGHLISPAEWINLLAVTGAIAFVLSNVDRQPWSMLGFSREAWRSGLLANTAALGAAAMVLTALMLGLSGQLHFEADKLSAFLSGDAASNSATVAWLRSTARITLVLAPSAMFEELIFRGYLWRVAEDASSARTALITTSVLFAVVHVQNPGADVVAIVNVGLAGLALGMLRFRTDSLPAAWAAHFAWNWTMAAALHVPVSGLPMTTPGYRAVVQGPDWWAGGGWGPEGGIAATLVLVVAIGAFGGYKDGYKDGFNMAFFNLSRSADRTAAARSA